MNITSKLGLGCGCLPAALLAFGAVVCFVLVGAGAINYSGEDTVMIVGAVLLALGLFCAVVGAVLGLIGFLQAKNAPTPPPPAP